MLHQIKTIEFTLVLICFTSGFASTIQAKTATSTQENARVLSERLSKRLGDLGSFQARYVVLKNKLDLRMSLLMTHDAVNKYYTLEYFDESDKCIGILLIDYRAAPVFMTFFPEKRTATRASFNTLLENQSHLFGALFKAIQEVESQNKRSLMNIDVSMTAPVFILQFTNDFKVTSVPAVSFDGKVSASWLDKERFLGAESIREDKSYTVVRYTPLHSLALDNQTGLIAEERWQDENRTERKRLVLNDQHKIDQAKPLERHIPNYAELDVQDSSFDRLMDAMAPYFLSGLAKAIEKKGELESMLGKWSGELKARTRDTTRGAWKKTFTAAVEAGDQPPGASELIRSFLLPEFKKQKGGGKASSFPDFLRKMERSDEFKKAVFALIGEQFDPKKMSDAYQPYLKDLPEDRMKILSRLMKTVQADYLEGKLQGYMDGVLYYAERNTVY